MIRKKKDRLHTLHLLEKTDRPWTFKQRPPEFYESSGWIEDVFGALAGSALPMAMQALNVPLGVGMMTHITLRLKTKYI